MLQRYRARRAAHKELMAKLDNLTDPTLIERMWADRNKSPFELLGEAFNAFCTALAKPVEDFARGFNNKREQ